MGEDSECWLHPEPSQHNPGLSRTGLRSSLLDLPAATQATRSQESVVAFLLLPKPPMVSDMKSWLLVVASVVLVDLSSCVMLREEGRVR
jgi:hypothetical protein